MKFLKLIFSKKTAIAFLLIALGLTIFDICKNKRNINEILIHVWPELLTAVFIFYILENGLQKIFDIPSDRIDTMTNDIINSIASAKETGILIMDTSIQSYFDEPNNKFKNSIEKAIKANCKIKILLLHPDTDAAHQRGDDLKRKKMNPEIDFEKEMRKGLRNLYMLIEDLEIKLGKDWNKNKLEIKLYKSTPTMTLVSSGERGYFNVLPAYHYDSKESRIITSMKTDFGKYLIGKFHSIWGAKEDDAKKVVDFDEFLYCNIYSKKNPKHRCNAVMWGGNDDDRFLPRYLILHTNNPKQQNEIDHLSNDIINTPNLVLTIENSKRSYDVTVERQHVFLEDDNGIGKTEYMMALSKISRTYGWDSKKCEDEITGRTIYEIKYEREKFNIQSETYEVSEKINHQNSGYVFLSHRQLDIDISHRFLDQWATMNECFKELPQDKIDREILTKRKDKSVVPRKRVMCYFDVTREKGITTVERRDSNKTYPGIFEVYEDGKRIDARPDKEIDGIHILPTYQKLDAKHKQRFDHFLESIIKFDLENILGSSTHDRHISNWQVYFHMIRLEVREKERCIVKPERKAEDRNRQYQVVHLVQRFNVADGMTFIIDKDKEFKKPEDAKQTFNLHKPLDSIYINRSIVKFEVSDVCFYPFNKETKHKSGIRDSLVIEFKDITK